MPEHAMEETAAAVKRPMRSPEPAPHAHAPARGAEWDAGAHVPGTPAAVLAIQRAAGNQAVMRMLDARRPGHPLAGPSTAVQRLSEDELDDDVQAIREGELDDGVQRDSAALHEPSDAAIRSAAAEGVRTPSTTLPYLDRIQASFGRHSIAHVQAHVGKGAARASQAMNALAYASGNHVVFGATPDLRTAAHEAAHIVQQQAGVQLFGGIGRAGDPYEQHADAVADAVVASRSVEGLLEPLAIPAHQQTAAATRTAAPSMRAALVQRVTREEWAKTRERLIATNTRNKNAKAKPRNNRAILGLQEQYSYTNSGAFTIGDKGMRFWRSWAQQPYLFLQRNFKGDYDATIERFAGRDDSEAEKILNIIYSDAPAGKDDLGKRRAFMAALTQIIEAHKSRVPGADKLARALLRRIARRKLDFHTAFNRRNGLFVPAWAKAARAPLGGQQAARAMFSLTPKKSDPEDAFEKMVTNLGPNLDLLVSTVNDSSYWSESSQADISVDNNPLASIIPGTVGHKGNRKDVFTSLNERVFGTVLDTEDVSEDAYILEIVADEEESVGHRFDGGQFSRVSQQPLYPHTPYKSPGSGGGRRFEQRQVEEGSITARQRNTGGPSQSRSPNRYYLPGTHKETSQSKYNRNPSPGLRYALGPGVGGITHGSNKGIVQAGDKAGPPFRLSGRGNEHQARTPSNNYPVIELSQFREVVSGEFESYDAHSRSDASHMRTIEQDFVTGLQGISSGSEAAEKGFALRKRTIRAAEKQASKLRMPETLNELTLYSSIRDLLRESGMKFSDDNIEGDALFVLKSVYTDAYRAATRIISPTHLSTRVAPQFGDVRQVDRPLHAHYRHPYDEKVNHEVLSKKLRSNNEPTVAYKNALLEPTTRDTGQRTIRNELFGEQHQHESELTPKSRKHNDSVNVFGQRKPPSPWESEFLATLRGDSMASSWKGTELLLEVIRAARDMVSRIRQRRAQGFVHLSASDISGLLRAWRVEFTSPVREAEAVESLETVYAKALDWFANKGDEDFLAALRGEQRGTNASRIGTSVRMDVIRRTKERAAQRLTFQLGKDVGHILIPFQVMELLKSQMVLDTKVEQEALHIMTQVYKETFEDYRRSVYRPAWTFNAHQ